MSETKEVAAFKPQALVPTKVFAPGGVIALVERMEAEIRAVRTDISTHKGRAEIKSLAYKIARSKTALDDMGKKLNEDARARITAVDADRRIVRERLDALAAEVRAPLTAWEDAEKARIQGHEDALARIPAPPGYGQVETAAEIAQRIDFLRAYPPRDWREFQQRFEDTLAAEIGRMVALHDAAVTREAEQAELARLRAEAAERERQEAARRQAEREAQIAAEAAETARLQAEARAAEAAAEAERRASAERARIEHAARAAAGQARAETLAAERKAREAAQAAERAEAERVAEAERAEAARLAAERQAARELEAAVLAERQRLAAEAAEAERIAAARAANRAHQTAINREVLADLMGRGIAEDVAKVVIGSIARKEIRHVSIAY